MKDTKIQWATHTLRRREEFETVCVAEPVATLAQCDAITDFKTQLWIVGPWLYVMCIQIPAAVITAMRTAKAIAREYIEPPPANFLIASFAAPLSGLAILVAMAPIPTQRTFPRNLADFLASFDSVLFTDSIARSSLSRFAHFATRFLRHLLPLHRRNERRTTLQPTDFCRFGAIHNG